MELARAKPLRLQGRRRQGGSDVGRVAVRDLGNVVKSGRRR